MHEVDPDMFVLEIPPKQIQCDRCRGEGHIMLMKNVPMNCKKCNGDGWYLGYPTKEKHK